MEQKTDIKEIEKKADENIPVYNDDISKPICDIEQIKKLMAEGKCPTLFMAVTVGCGYLRKTDRMQKTKLTSKFSMEYGNRWNVTHPEILIRDLIIKYCNEFPHPQMLMERIKKDIEKNIIFKPKVKKTN